VSKPFLDERRLLKEIEAQGLTILTTAVGWRVLAKDGVGTAGIHPSVFTSQAGRRAYRNMLADLVRIGFDLDRIGRDNGDGGDARWKQEREEIERMIEQTNTEAAAQDEVRKQKELAEADITARLHPLPERSRELYHKIRQEPGLSPREYATRSGDPDISPDWARNSVAPLVRAGLVEVTGKTKAVRWWIAGEVPEELPATARAPRRSRAKAKAAKNGKPSAGSVRVRHTEPADKVVRFRKMGEKLERSATEMAETSKAMVEAYAEQETELREAKVRLRDLEKIFSQAVDRL
jgi:hypothetical protein